MSPARRRAGRPLGLLLVAAAVLAASSGPLRAQDEPLTWDLPAFHSPYSAGGTGVHVTLPDDLDGFAASAIRRFPTRVADLGVRAGLGAIENELALSAGGDVRTLLARADSTFPLDAVAVVGAGLGWMPKLDAVLIRLPVGMSAGRRLGVAGGSVAVYAYPRLALDARFSPEPLSSQTPGGRGIHRRGDRLSLHADVDLGVDVELASGFRIRGALTLGHNEALGFGFFF